MTPLFAVGAAVVLVFVLAWAWAVRIDNYSIVDAVWAWAIGLAAVVWLVLGEGDAAKRVVAGVMIAFWSVRLGSHLSYRIARAHPEEDGRYRNLRNRWKGKERPMFFGFFGIQAFSVILLALPFYPVSIDADHFGIWEATGAALALASIGGEAIADRQKENFRKSHDHHAVCDVGLWRHSRHPNYFFESLVWVGFYVFACGSANGWMTIHAPLMILFLLLRVTGVPSSEASSLASKGEAYRRYQRRTSVFIPLPVRGNNRS